MGWSNTDVIRYFRDIPTSFMESEYRRKEAKDGVDMLRRRMHVADRVWLAVSVITLLVVTPASTQNIISLDQIRPNKACGPKCLAALIKTTGVGQQDCDIKCIYEMIGKPPFTPTSLKDLHSASGKLGFQTKGCKLDLKELRKMKGYAILPVGLRRGTVRDILHFILVKRVIDNYVIVINTKTLKTNAIEVNDLKKVWNGYALLILSHNRSALPKSPDDDTPPHNMIGRDQSGEIAEIWDFGMAASGALLEHTFIIHNKSEGDCTAKIVNKSCTCLDAKIGSDVAGNTTLSMNLRVKQPGWQEAFVIVAFEPNKSIKRYLVKAFGKEMFKVDPAKGYIEVSTNKVIEYPIKIHYFTDINDCISYDHIRTSIKNIDIGDVSSENMITDSNAVKHTFEVPLLFKCQLDDVRKDRTIEGQIQFFFNTSQGERMVKFDLIINKRNESVKVFPKQIFMMVSKQASIAQKKIKLQFIKKPYPDSIGFQIDKNLPVEVNSATLVNNEYTANITINSAKIEGNQPGTHKGIITFVPHGNGDMDPIKLPVNMVIRP